MRPTCVVCLDACEAVIRCSDDHAMCSECFISYVRNFCEGCKETDLQELTSREKEVFGKIACPCSGNFGTCKAAPFSDTAVVTAVASSAETLEAYLQVQHLL